ncbi:MAG: DUF308 domain-containing protein [Paludibacter sp.]|nr:DUF308 domain-containing protein [Bacteroidales bacterium]MCM1068872.1 DUF308 domain-containing protein [Prevotella sp.]MCM1353133.1 DUF308 domain-containing protein [Bacteroides sp.]MCM1442455.1 DUF308 domain-containing protein [Muribaculum sp.]MCM1481298.1 DUF308 domain-containing protein [Paludibacter sp.]
MENSLQTLARKATQTVKHWWLVLICGILGIATGIAAFCCPAEFYLTLSIVFGVIMLLSGIVEIVLYCTSHSYFVASGLNLLGGILDIILGIFLCSNIALSAALLPLMLGIWILFRSIQMIDFWSRMRTFGISGAGWQVFFGLLLLVLSLAILLNPLKLGASLVIVLSGCGLLIAGVALCFIAFRLKNIHTFVKKNIVEDVTAIEV